MSVANDWPNWRGPHHDGISRATGLLDAWPPSGPRLAWQRPLPGGYSSLVVSQGRLITPTKTRARIYDREGVLLLDSRSLRDVLRFDLPPPSVEAPNPIERTWIAIRTWLGRGDLPAYRELGPDNGKGYFEVAQALAGHPASAGENDIQGSQRLLVSIGLNHELLLGQSRHFGGHHANGFTTFTPL